jgi:hypothetical protein
MAVLGNDSEDGQFQGNIFVFGLINCAEARCRQLTDRQRFEKDVSKMKM